MQVRVELFAATKVELARIDRFHGPSATDWPYVDCTDWLDGLDRLVADLTGRDVEEFGEHDLIFPENDDGTWKGPWLLRVAADVVEAMAWMDYDLLSAVDEETTERNLDLRDLCFDAVGAERHVYQWSTA